MRAQHARMEEETMARKGTASAKRRALERATALHRRDAGKVARKRVREDFALVAGAGRASVATPEGALEVDARAHRLAEEARRCVLQRAREEYGEVLPSDMEAARMAGRVVVHLQAQAGAAYRQQSKKG